MKNWFIAAAATLLMSATGAVAGEPIVAGKSCTNCGTGVPSIGHGHLGHGHGGGPALPTMGHMSKFHHQGFDYGWRHPFKTTLPVYMAAPWYLYWPYDGHFQTVAPMAYGAFYPPPSYTGNPYMPGGYGGYVPNAPIPQFPVAPFPPVAPNGRP